MAFKLVTEIEQHTNLKKVFEERILDCQKDFSLHESLGIAKEPNAPKINIDSILMRR